MLAVFCETNSAGTSTASSRGARMTTITQSFPGCRPVRKLPGTLPPGPPGFSEVWLRCPTCCWNCSFQSVSKSSWTSEPCLKNPPSTGLWAATRIETHSPDPKRVALRRRKNLRAPRRKKLLVLRKRFDLVPAVGRAGFHPCSIRG